MQFTIRDIMWLTIIVALLIVHFKDRADTLEREQSIERLVHKVDQDVHGHLEVLEDWSNYVDREIHENGKRMVGIEGDISNLQTDVGALEGKWPKRGSTK